MKYDFDEIHTLNLLSDNPEYSKRFNTPKDLKIVTCIILLAVFVVLAVAIIFKVDKIVPAKGVLDTKAELFAIRNNQEGYVEKIGVREGDIVKAGDILVQFDTRLLDLDIDALQQSLSSLHRSLWSDFYQLKPVFSSEEILQLTDRLASVDKPKLPPDWKKTLTAPILQSLSQNTQAQADTQLQLENRRKQLRSAQKALLMDQLQLQSLTKLYEKQIESRLNLERQQRQVLESQSSVDDIDANIRQLQLSRQSF